MKSVIHNHNPEQEIGMSGPEALNRCNRALVSMALCLIAPRKLMTGTIITEKTSDGWKVRDANGLVPLIAEHHVAKFRKLVVSGFL